MTPYVMFGLLVVGGLLLGWIKRCGWFEDEDGWDR